MREGEAAEGGARLELALVGLQDALASAVELVHAALALAWRLAAGRWAAEAVCVVKWLCAAAARDRLELAPVALVLELELAAVLAVRVDGRVLAIHLAPCCGNEREQLL